MNKASRALTNFMKRRLLNRQRDWLDVATIALSLLAIVSSIALPLIIRSLDQADRIPSITLRAGYLKAVSSDLYPELMDRLTTAFDLLHHIERKQHWSSPFPLSKHFASLLKPRMFEVILTNNKPTPVSLTDWHAVEVEVERPDKNTSSATTVTAIQYSDGRFEIRPVVVLAPYESKKLVFLVSYLISPSDKNANQLCSTSVTRDCEALISSGNTNIHKRSQMSGFQLPDKGRLLIGFGDPLASNQSGQGYEFSDTQLFYRVFSAALQAQVARLRPVTTKIIATDHLGRVHKSNLVDFRHADY